MRRGLGCIEDRKGLICRYKQGTVLLASKGGHELSFWFCVDLFRNRHFLPIEMKKIDPPGSLDLFLLPSEIKKVDENLVIFDDGFHCNRGFQCLAWNRSLLNFFLMAGNCRSSVDDTDVGVWLSTYRSCYGGIVKATGWKGPFSWKRKRQPSIRVAASTMFKLHTI